MRHVVILPVQVFDFKTLFAQRPVSTGERDDAPVMARMANTTVIDLARNRL